MRNTEQWQPTKFVYERGKLVASRDSRHIGLASRIMANAVAVLYDRYLPVYASGSLLDLGCGKTPLFAVYREHVTRITCVDWGESLHSNPYTDVIADLNGELPFPDASFDTILLSDVIAHIYHPHRLWGEMSRVLRPGGYTLLNTPFYYCLNETPHDYFRLSEFSLRRLSVDSGLNVVTLESLGGALSILGDIITRLARRLPSTGRFLAIAIHFLVSWGLKTSWGAKADTRTAVNFPFGYFMVLQNPLA